jgi:hypothetical protein
MSSFVANTEIKLVKGTMSFRPITPRGNEHGGEHICRPQENN